MLRSVTTPYRVESALRRAMPPVFVILASFTLASLTLASSPPFAAGAAPTSLEELVTEVAQHREAGRLEEAVATVRTIARRRFEGEAMPETTAGRYRSELAALEPLVLQRFRREDSAMRAVLDKLLGLAPVGDRTERRRTLVEAERAARAAPALLPDEDAATARQLEWELSRIVLGLESQPLLGLGAGGRLVGLRQAVDRGPAAADAACAAADAGAAQRALAGAEAAERELAVCVDAVRVWQEQARPLLGGSGPDAAAGARARARDFVNRLGSLARAADQRQQTLRNAIDAGETAARLLPTARRHLEDVRRRQPGVDALSADLWLVRSEQGKPRTEASDGAALASANDAVRDLEEAAVVGMRIALDVVTAKGEIDAARQKIAAHEVTIARHAAQAEAIEQLCLPGFDAAKRHVARAGACHRALVIAANAAAAPAPSPPPADVRPATPPAPPSGGSRDSGGAGGTQGRANPAPPVSASPDAARRVDARPPSPPGSDDAPDDNTFGGIQVVAPARPARVPVGGRLALQALDKGRHPIASVQWTSLDTSRLLVAQDGVVTGVQPGVASVMARAPDGGWTTLEVEVVAGDRAAVQGRGNDPSAWGLDDGAVAAQPALEPSAGDPQRAGGSDQPAGWGMEEGRAWAGRSAEALASGQEVPESSAASSGAASPGSAPPPVEPAADSPPGLHGTWRLNSGRTVSFDCGRGSVCVFSGFNRGDSPIPLSPDGPRRWRGSQQVVGRSGSSGMPMHVTSVDDTVYEVTISGDRGVVRWSNPRVNRGQPTDVAMARVAGGGAVSPQTPAAAAGPNATPLDASRAGPYHEFAALCRVGWAWGLASTSVGPADRSIAEHLAAAGEHMMMANQSTFAPLQAWPNWSARRTRFRDMGARLLQSGTGRYREQLAFDLDLGWSEMANALGLQIAGAVERRENCDSHYARLGYLLCSGQQLLQVAEVEEREGDHDRAVRLAQQGRQQLVAARREVDGLRTVRLASGSCLDLSRVAAPLDASSSTREAAGAVAQANSAFATAIEILSGAPVPQQPSPAAQHELLGQWCYSMFLDQKDLDHPEHLCRIAFAEEGGWVVGRLVAGSCTPKRAESLLITPTPAGGQVLLRVRKAGPGRYEGRGLTFNTEGKAELELHGDRITFYRTDNVSRGRRHLFRCAPGQ